MPTFRSTHPIDFDLYDKDTQNVLYIEDVSDQQLTLQITNRATEQITLNTLSGAAGANNHHFVLRFRPGTISAASLSGANAMTLADDTATNWQLAGPEQDSEGMDVLYLKSTVTSLVLTPDVTLNLVFNNVGASATEGPRGTRVELQCRNMAYASSGTAIDTNREIHLSIVNHRGKKDMPLFVGFVGDNGVLNDGRTTSTLTLRLSNTLVYDNTNPDLSTLTFKHNTDPTLRSRLIISFDTGPVAEEWALGTDAEVAAITITQPAGWHLEVPQAGQTPEWVLYPDSEDQLLTGKNGPGTQYIDLALGNIITAHPTGHTNIYIRYENVPGYWDGQKVQIIDKRPLILNGQKVGIGTNNPNGTLELFGSSSNAKLKFGGTGGDVHHVSSARDLVLNSAKGEFNFRQTDYNSASSYTDVLTVSNGKIGLGTEPDTPLTLMGNGGTYPVGITQNQVGGSATFEITTCDGARQLATRLLLRGNSDTANIEFYRGARGSEQLSVFIEGSNGKVGIGTNTPREALEVQGRIRDQAGFVMPAGGIIMWSGSISEIPDGWALCDGNNNTPNLSGRFIVGYQNGNTDYGQVGNTGGQNQVTLTINQMPAHNHDLKDGQGGDNTGSIKGDNSPNLSGQDRARDWYNSTNLMKNTGGGQPHENRPAYFVLAFIMKQ